MDSLNPFELTGKSPQLEEVIKKFRVKKFPRHRIEEFFNSDVWETVKKMTRERLQGIWLDLERGTGTEERLRGEAVTCRFILKLPELLIQKEDEQNANNRNKS